MQRGRKTGIIIALLVVTASMIPTSPVLAKPSSPCTLAVPSLARVGLYPTQVVATVKSLQLVKSSNTDVVDPASDQTLFLVKLRIHTSKPLTLQGTVINDDESINVISREPIDSASIGKTVTALIEMRGDSTRQHWLMTDIIVRSR
jgi:hypothetical protein